MSKFTLISDREVVFGRPEGKKDMVFAIIYTEEAKPYLHYSYFLNNKDPELRAKANLNVPCVLAQVRWDGKFGFVGGHVEEWHNSLLEGLHDELHEEIGWDLTLEELTAIAVPHATYTNGSVNISSYKIKVDYETLKMLQANADKGEHFLAENCGNVILQVFDNGKINSYQNIMNQTFSGTGNLEFAKLVEDEQLLDKVSVEAF